MSFSRHGPCLRVVLLSDKLTAKFVSLRFSASHLRKHNCTTQACHRGSLKHNVTDESIQHYDSRCSGCMLDAVEKAILILILGIIRQVHWYYLITILVILLRILHSIMSDLYRADATQHPPGSFDSSTKMTPNKRKAEFDENVAPSSAMRRKSIMETIAREQSKRKWDDDSIDSLCQPFSKRLRCQPEEQAPLKVTRPHKASRQKLIIEARLSRIKRYRDRWIPYKPPWITSRVLKQYVSAEGWRKRSVFCPCPERYVEGLESVCASIPYGTGPST